MTQTARKNLYDRATTLCSRLQKRYRLVDPVRGQDCFLCEPNRYFLVTPLPWEDVGAIVIEHALGKEEYDVGRFEDGDLFWMDEMSEDEMFAAMVAEIEDN